MRTFVLIALVCSAVCVSALKSDIDDHWTVFKSKFNKAYATETEELKRKEIFEAKAEKIAAHNREYDLGLQTYKKGLNKFSDLTYEEFKAAYTGRTYDARLKTRQPNPYKVKYGQILAADVDWRDQGAVTGVKDQGQCGSCWAFSATGGIEGQLKLGTGTIASISEQQLVDCDTQEDAGCNGGNMQYAFGYVQQNGGINSESDYPYTARDGNCHPKAKNAATLSGYKEISAGSETSLQSAVQSVGPISIAIDASDNFQDYSSGVLNDNSCSASALNHGVLAVGYGTEGSTDYWIVKNSWGGSWGEQGYIRMSRNKSNQCGVASDASYPTGVNHA